MSTADRTDGSRRHAEGLAWKHVRDGYDAALSVGSLPPRLIRNIGPSREAAIREALERHARAAVAERKMQGEVRPTMTDAEGA